MINLWKGFAILAIWGASAFMVNKTLSQHEGDGPKYAAWIAFWVTIATVAVCNAP